MRLSTGRATCYHVILLSIALKKEDYGEQDIKEQMRKQMQAELSDYLSYVQAHPEVSPYFLLTAFANI